MSSASETQSSAGRHPSDKRGIIPNLFGLVSRIFGVLFFSAFMSIIVEWVGMTWWFADDYSGYSHAQMMLQQELTYLNTSAREGTMDTYAAVKANHYVESVIDFAFFQSGVMSWLHSTHVTEPGDNQLVLYFKQIQSVIYDYLVAMAYTLMTFIVRVTILTLSLPVFFIFGFVALADGLMKRDLRRFTGGHESSFVYHIAKGFSTPMLVLGWIVYLAMPISIHPNYIITPFAALFAFAIFIASSKFKKYL
ncbi:TIGR03747 family integrating conjugative element membrane protein [Marinobacterium lutimaris]|uniref:Integrating conjugative element membrane protein, PFL_4697 family n=1 Tax=Marinobacterium lutimaris TaxID=568106 RepID=A0A1H6DXR2_9GAMM|nr:TIGR03747 family integrating conjugative element membrane protein [Marinobacterium lutimaris]SEG89526.1 integrating conjugative element membrane protein, PFL_4697 family [Marinobacterium lutimaris]